jgi:hypothetical protein
LSAHDIIGNDKAMMAANLINQVVFFVRFRFFVIGFAPGRGISAVGFTFMNARIAS